MKSSFFLRLTWLGMAVLLSLPAWPNDREQSEWPATPSRLQLITPYGRLHISQSDYIYEARLLLNGQETVPSVMGLLNIPYAFSTADYHLALISIDSGEEHCPVKYKWVWLDTAGHHISEGFGSCSDRIRVFVDNNHFTLQTPNLEEPDKIDTYIFDGKTVVLQQLAS